MPTTTRTPPNSASFDAAAAAEAIAMNVAMPALAILKAGALAKDLKRLPATTNQADQIIMIVDCAKPDLVNLRETLLEQCRELTKAKQSQPGNTSKRALGGLADRCLDIAVDCAKAIKGYSTDQ